MTWNSIKHKFVKKTSLQTLSKVFSLSSPWPVRNPSIPSNTTFRRFVVDWEDLKPYWKSGKRLHFSRWWIILLFTSFWKTLLTTERRLTMRYFLAVGLYPTFLNTGTTDKTFQQSGKCIFRYTLSDRYWRVQLVCIKV